MIESLKINRYVVIAIMAVSLACAGYALMKDHRAGSEAAYHHKTEDLAIVTQAGKRHSFDVEIAATAVDQQVGLMFRKEMPKDHGMLFQMGQPPRKVSFWMKNTLIPLDMIFIGADGTIVNIHSNATPETLASVPSEKEVTGVLELNGGRAAELGIAIGDKVDHPYFQ